MKNSNVLMIGGPKHGKVVAMPSGGSYLSYIDSPAGAPSFATVALADEYAVWPLKTVSCPIIQVRLGPREVRRVAHAPGISKDTAESYFWDVVVDAYDRAARVL
jgi:hypothetical protein